MSRSPSGWAAGPADVRPRSRPQRRLHQPELAAVGLTEEQAQGSGASSLQVGRFLFRANGRAKALGEQEGMVKLIADAGTDRLLGAHLVGPRVSELIAELVLALELGGQRRGRGPRRPRPPTLSEAVKEAALAVGRARHPRLIQSATAGLDQEGNALGADQGVPNGSPTDRPPRLSATTSYSSSAAPPAPGIERAIRFPTPTRFPARKPLRPVDRRCGGRAPGRHRLGCPTSCRRTAS